MTRVTVLVLLAITAFCWGGYTIACELRQCPDGKVSKALMGAARVKAVKPKTIWAEFLQTTGKKISRFVLLDDLRREKIQNALSIAGENCTPEEYVARAISGGLAALACGIMVGVINPMLVAVGLVLAAAVGLYLYYSVFDTVRKRQKTIEAEVPRFSLSLSQSLKNDRDVLKILTAYRKVAGIAFAAELDKTVAAMKSGSYEDALLRLAARVGSLCSLKWCGA